MSPSPPPLDPAEIEAALAELEGWAVQDGKLHKDYRFRDFVDAFAFMSAVAILAERADHHPEWFNVYDRVTVDLITHDAGPAVTRKDLDLAKAMDERAGN